MTQKIGECLNPKRKQTTIELTNAGFSPEKITIQEDDEVLWNNKDTKQYQFRLAKCEPDRELYQTDLRVGQSASFIFYWQGEYCYTGRPTGEGRVIVIKRENKEKVDDCVKRKINEE